MTGANPPAEAGLIDRRYRLGPRLGAGGVAEVFQAFDERLHRDVAIKVFRGDVGEELSRHGEEMRTLARLNHPALVTVFDAGVDAATGRPFLVMALVEGTTLADELQPGALPAARTAAIGETLADALAYVHGQGVIHRDIKPANVLISVDGRVHLADFGIARLADSAHVTRAGDVLGTPAYFAPEQVNGEVVGPPADVYALGLVLLECLTGRREYDGPAMEAALARLNRPPAIPRELPEAWRDLLTAMTALHPAARISAAQAADRLRAITSGDTQATTVMGGPLATPATAVIPAATQVMPPAPPPAAVAAPPPNRGRRVMLGLLAIVILAAIGVAIAIGINRSGGGGSAHCSFAKSQSSNPLPHRLENDMQRLESLVCG
ncbi:MAG TPA: serine/threonine-protein kinase [Mycobacteriales bacterium]|nr:serine/threonine-protein kinase [Mycobacteriales bacterium]